MATWLYDESAALSASRKKYFTLSSRHDPAYVLPYVSTHLLTPESSVPGVPGV